MKTILLLLLGVATICTNTTTAQEPSTTSPQTVHSIVKVQHSYDWYVKQNALWKTELEKTPKNPAGWLSYYTATRMAKILSPDDDKRAAWQEKMGAVVEAMKKPINGSYEYHYIQGYNESDHTKQMPHVFKAYEMDPERTDTYDDLLAHYEITRDKKKSQEIAKKWKASGDYSPEILLFNYNMLVSTAPNSILLTHGDNDTYPAWLLQQAEGVRPDVQVMNINLLQLKDYRDLLFKELNIPLLEQPKSSTEVVNHLIKHKGDRPLYVSLTTPYERWGIADQVCNVGMALRYGEAEEQTLSYLLYNYEHTLLLDHLQCSIYTASFPMPTTWFNKLYVPGLMMLHKHYALTNNQKEQRKTERMIRRIIKDWPEQADVIAELEAYEGKMNQD